MLICFRRVNPNLPPRFLACEHQLANPEKVECEFHCDKECKPTGHNIPVDWDKTSKVKGKSYFHCDRRIKHLFDSYEIVRKKYCESRGIKDFDDPDKPFFINSLGGRLRIIDMSRVKKQMNMNVTPYSFRRLITTWGLESDKEEIRDAEEEALQHANKVAQKHYALNKSSKPQKFVQQYILEERFFPSFMTDMVEANAKKLSEQVRENENEKERQRFKELEQRQKKVNLLKMDLRELGPNQKIRGSDRARLSNIFKKEKNIDLLEEAQNRDVKNWRQWILREICSTEGNQDAEI